MATKIVPTDNFERSANDQQLKISCLIWLNNDLNDPEIVEAEQKLKSTINSVKKFDNVSICKNYIEKQSQNDRLVIIVSGQLGREIVPSIHMFQSVLSIYVYCMDTTSNKQWSSNFAKVKAVVDELDELVFRIKADYETQKMAKKPLPIKFFIASGGDGSKSTTDVNGQFIWSEVLLDCLLRLKSTKNDINELIERCKNEYEGNDFELNNIHEFENHYSYNKILLWYTRDSFFYKTLHAALCTENIHMTFLFRTFISDIQRQLNKHQVKQPLRVYRSQMMSSDQLETLKANCGQFISVNTFLSTSTDKQRALAFINVSDATDNLKPILFEIDADPTMGATKPFADISPHSDFPGEPEILFMIGSIFRLKSVHSTDGQLWIIQLALCNDNEPDLKTFFMYMKKELGSGGTNLQTLGKLLRKTGKIDLAEQYFTRLVKELPSNDPLLSDLYEDLSELASQSENYDMSVQWHQKSVALNTGAVIANIPVNAKWAQNGITVAGGQGIGNTLNRLCYPRSLFLDDNQTMFIADTNNHRILQWKVGDTDGKVVAGGRGTGKRLDQLCFPTDVLIDKETESLIICDQGNRQVVRWSCRSGTTHGEVLLQNIYCRKLVMDDQRRLYISDAESHEVRRYEIGDKNGTLVAGGHGRGDSLSQFNMPADIFVDREYAVYVSDEENHRVMKWNKGATKGIVVAGGEGEGRALTQLCHPNGLFVDALDTVYVIDSRNSRIMRWLKEETIGAVVVGGNREGEGANQFNGPLGLFVDRNGHFYVVDMRNHRIQRFPIE